MAITHLAYADDLLLLSRADVRSVSMILQCVNNFGDMAGLRINFSKSNVYLGSVPENESRKSLIYLDSLLGSCLFDIWECPLRPDGLLPRVTVHLWMQSQIKLLLGPETRYLMQGSLNLSAKTLWNIHMKKDCWWIKWVNHEYSHLSSVWSWDWSKEQSPLIKQIIALRDEMILAHGSVQASIAMLGTWFGCSQGLSNAYDFFVGRWNRWPWKPLIAKCCILPKHRFLLWLVSHRKLLTRDRLGYLLDRSCFLCNYYAESVSHLFFDCPIARSIWN
ncbi:uncharacterized protein [Primulina huaijiensis]|uniref:uncharacterized protein n=1 Tax=Primulina huaijiensis TaxID=1492673 RepID=UPI003CC70A19